MAFVAVATSVGAAVLGTGAAAGIGSAIVGGALIGAGVGGLYSAITGDGDILNSMLTGGLIGGAGAGLGSAAGIGSTAPTATGLGAPGAAATTVNTAVPALNAAQLGGMSASQAAALTPAQLNAIAASQGVLAEGAATLPGAGLMAAPEVITPQLMAATGAGGTVAPVTAGLSGNQLLGYGLAGTTAMQLLGNKKAGAGAPTDPGMVRPYTFSSNPTTATGNYPSPYATAQYDAAGMPIMDTRERNYFDQKYSALTPYSAKTGTVNPNVPAPIGAAGGGLMAIGGPVPRYAFGGLTPIEDLLKQMPSSAPKYSYDQANQRYNQVEGGTPQNLEAMPKYTYNAKDQKYTQMAQGGAADLGDYSDGGRLLKGPGDGVSDDIPATIAGKQPARLADGEFVIPARIVSEIGNGSTDAGAKRLYAMMDRIQAGRKKTIGKKNVAKDTKAKKHLLA
jgi:hypothetical protein